MGTTIVRPIHFEPETLFATLEERGPLHVAIDSGRGGVAHAPETAQVDTHALAAGIECGADQQMALGNR